MTLCRTLDADRLSRMIAFAGDTDSLVDRRNAKRSSSSKTLLHSVKKLYHSISMLGGLPFGDEPVGVMITYKSVVGRGECYLLQT